jgi:two-component system NtrC family sensor kinase
VEDVTLEALFDPVLDGVEGFSTKSLLCVPLLVRDRAMGAISLINNIDGPFEKRDVDLLVTLAASVAVAVANARLVHEITAANVDLQDSRREIERSRSTLLTLFDNLDDELYIVDRKYNLIALNRSKAGRVGKEPQKLVGNLCHIVLEGNNKPCFECRAQETFEKRIKTQRTEKLRMSEGHTVEREIYTYPIVDAEGNVVQTILQLRDVTQQRRLEVSLVQAEKLAALGQLAAGVAHELNNPITAVIANTQLLQRELDPSNVDMESVELIEQAGKRAQRVVRELLDFARQEAEEFRIVDVNHTIQQALSLVERQWQRVHVKLIRDLTPDILEVFGNADHLQGVWLNLLVNAYDALQGKPGTVVVRSRKVGDFVTVNVEDDGVGIQAEDVKRIFEPFFTTKVPGKGTGLGLATSFRIIEQHQGKIDVDSIPGSGALFTIRLPIVKK